MGTIDQFGIVQLGAGSAREGIALSTEANWNQTEADWTFFLTQGTVFGIRNGDGLLIATAALLPYSESNAWISMVLVTASWRRRGLATKLVDACLKRAATQGLTPWLDATPAGATVYGPLGFKAVLELRRLRLAGGRTPAARATTSNGSIDKLISRDRRAMGFERSALLLEFVGRSRFRLLSHGDGNSLALVRDGRVARHIGPILADDTASAMALVEAIAARETDPLLMDVVAERRDFLESLTSSGWSIERPFQRMRFGPAIAHNAELPFAVAGPEFG